MLIVQFDIYFMLLNFYKSTFECYQGTFPSLTSLYTFVSMLNSYDWLALLCLIFVLICPCLLILGGMHIVYVMTLLLVN